MFTQKPTSRAEVAWVGFALTWAAGFVDAVGYLTLRNIYVANMSGNTVAVAIHVAQGDWGPAWAHFCPLLAFFPGLVAGDAIVELCERAGLRAALAPAFLVEAAGLGLFLFVASRSVPVHGVVPAHSGAVYVLLVGLLAFSMGLQNGLLRRVSGLKDVHTYVTGTLLAAAHGFTTYLFWLGRRLRYLSPPGLGRALRYSPHHRSLRQALLASALWVLYIVGAVIGAILRGRYGIGVLLTPLGILLMVGAVDVLSPVRKLRR